jgi:hypothetical protein
VVWRSKTPRCVRALAEMNADVTKGRMRFASRESGFAMDVSDGLDQHYPRSSRDFEEKRGGGVHPPNLHVVCAGACGGAGGQHTWLTKGKYRLHPIYVHN